MALVLVFFVKMILHLTVFLTFLQFTFETIFTDAAARGDLATVEEMITQNLFSVDDIAYEESRTALFFAAENGHLEVVNFLIRNKANVNLTDDFRHTPLFVSAGEGNVEVVKSLISNNAMVDRCDYHGFTSLMHASLGGHTEVVKILLLNKAELEREAFGHTALKFAVTNEYPDVVDFLLSSGANPLKVQDNEIVQKFFKKMEFFDFSSFAKNLPHTDGSLVEIIEETVKSAI
jgi:ankyrin repeat protein